MKDSFLIVMAGGSGTRFWPKSTSLKPKQLLRFGRGGTGPTLLEVTLDRFDGMIPPANRIIVTTDALRGDVQSLAKKGTVVLGEPSGRNTAPCVYWAAREVAKRSPDGVMLVMPSDHHIIEPDAFRATVKEAVEWARGHDDLVTLGVAPTRPETGYGYLRAGAKVAGTCRKVDAFVEKPNVEKAKEFVASGNYLWNGGMFVWRADVILAAYEKFMPEMKDAWERYEGDVEAAYASMTATSIDYGIMERAKNVVTFALDCGWNDLGSWDSLEGLADELGIRGEGGVVSAGECVAIDAKGNIVDVPNRLVALLGVQDLIIVEAGKSLLVARKDRAQDIKSVVAEVRRQRPDLV